MSRVSYNGTFYYDDQTFQARITGAYRSHYLISSNIASNNNNYGIYSKSTFNVDASASYKFSEKLMFTFDALNLTIREGQVMEPEAFQHLPEAEQQRIRAVVEVFETDLAEILRQVPAWQREIRERLRQLKYAAIKVAVDALLVEIKKAYAGEPRIQDYLAAVEADVIDGPQSVVWDEAENRLHVQKALMEYLLLGRL